MIHSLPSKAITAIALSMLIALNACEPGAGSGVPDATPSHHTTQQVVVPDSIMNYLIDSAVQDFRTHRPPTAIDVRNARIGYLNSSEGDKVFLLCGEFLSEEEPGKWTEFTTIKTSGYEQYIGHTTYCADAIVVHSDEKLTQELKRRLNA
ncbi:MAG TPA: hypothetical protein PL010_12960 [Flavobacteriales bacterium]|jgi:hypothetical protein|nr:hypothetical protein [Flavobacteriales bacterium]HMW97614.1 hypothetical protein [Flavobacteriales bacterium]HMZ48280.1 hypothetical protein [Flavobacteriales bacterium]HNE79731.1 hypothetical protein [Flavobacteriales bacterium]HNI05528.1 hypothetical protein [Flavobacteriales bacterium]